MLYQDLELWLLLTRRFQYARTTTRSEHVVRAFQLGNFACPQPCDFLRHRSEQLVPRKSEAGAVIEQFTDRLVNIIQHYFFQTFVIASFNLFSIITIYTSHLYYYYFFFAHKAIQLFVFPPSQRRTPTLRLIFFLVSTGVKQNRSETVNKNLARSTFVPRTITPFFGFSRPYFSLRSLRLRLRRVIPAVVRDRNCSTHFSPLPVCVCRTSKSTKNTIRKMTIRRTRTRRLSVVFFFYTSHCQLHDAVVVGEVRNLCGCPTRVHRKPRPLPISIFCLFTCVRLLDIFGVSFSC